MISSNEQLVTDLSHDAYPLLISALQEEYPNKFPLVCGPSSIVLSRLLSHETDIPLGVDEPGEHFELYIGIYNPEELGSYPAGDHTHLRYHDGTGRTTYIDNVYTHLWNPRGDTSRPIIETYPADAIDTALRSNYMLAPFSPGLAADLKIDLWGWGDNSTTEDHRDMVAAMHDARAFQSAITTDSGICVETDGYWGARTSRVLRAVGGSTILAHSN